MLVAAVKRGDQVFAPVLAPGDGGCAAFAPAKPAKRIRAAATSSGRSRRRHRAPRRADRIPACRAHRQSPCGSDAASAWCRSASRGPTQRRMRRAPPRASSGVAFWRRERTSTRDGLVCPRDGRVEIRGLEAAFDHDIAGASSCTRGAPGVSASCASTTARQVGDLDRRPLRRCLRPRPGGGDDGRDRLAGEAHHVGPPRSAARSAGS